MQGYQKENQMQFLCSEFKETLDPQNSLYKLKAKIPRNDISYLSKVILFGVDFG